MINVLCSTRDNLAFLKVDAINALLNKGFFLIHHTLMKAEITVKARSITCSTLWLPKRSQCFSLLHCKRNTYTHLYTINYGISYTNLKIQFSNSTFVKTTFSSTLLVITTKCKIINAHLERIVWTCNRLLLEYCMWIILILCITCHTGWDTNYIFHW